MVINIDMITIILKYYDDDQKMKKIEILIV